jgi:hypothetical protein
MVRWPEARRRRRARRSRLADQHRFLFSFQRRAAQCRRRPRPLVDRRIARPRFRARSDAPRELRVEAFNLLNTSQLGNPVTNLNSATFGRILSAGDPRIMQFAVKYTS